MIWSKFNSDYKLVQKENKCQICKRTPALVLWEDDPTGWHDIDHIGPYCKACWIDYVKDVFDRNENL